MLTLNVLLKYYADSSPHQGQNETFDYAGQ